ncbi:RidA family protein (plasmid) [Halorussus salilacus]|uniref:RidA family protein n=1 Tax=Halorussus salilacus TaxID=2953750 RepID=UPI00209E45F7|nr:RidA family protein [Halorussus salilacus]USZ69967.1 RidA family protein [Halorussus salilacus]
MDKTAILPEGRTVESDDLDEPASSYGTVTHHADHARVVFSGSIWPEGGVAEQVRQILAHKEMALGDLGGTMDDVVSMQFFVRDDVLSRETQGEIHEVRSEFFSRPHYPASTMVGVASLLDPDALVEVELEAEIPNDGWDTDVITG